MSLTSGLPQAPTAPIDNPFLCDRIVTRSSPLVKGLCLFHYHYSLTPPTLTSPCLPQTGELWAELPGARMPRRAPRRAPLTAHLPPPDPKLSPSPSGHQVAPPDHEGPALPGPAGGAPAPPGASEEGASGVFVSPTHPMVRPTKGRVRLPLSSGPLRRHASDFLPRTPRGATHGRLGRLSRISEITRLTQLKSVP